MAEKLLTISYDISDLMAKYNTAIKDENVYEAMLVYNRLREFNIPEINLRQASVYAKLQSYASETNYLLKCIDDIGFYAYNPQAVLVRISAFFNVYCMVDVFDFYKAILQARHPDDERLSLLPNPNTKRIQKDIHFVEDEGKFLYVDAMNFMTNGEPEKAIDAIDKIDKKDAMYVKAQNFKSAIYATRGDIEKSKEITFDLLDEKGCNVEVIENLYKVTGLNEEERQKVLALLDGLENDNSYEVAMAKALLFMDERNYVAALKALSSITGYAQYIEACLKQKCVCCLILKNKEQLLKHLKMLYTIYPSNIGARCLYLNIENDDFSLDVRWIYGIFDKPMIKTIKQIVKQELATVKSINNFSLEQAEFMFNVVCECGDYIMVKKATSTLLKSKYKFLIQDALLDVTTKSTIRQLMFQSIVENLSQDEWTFLVNGRIDTFRVCLPEMFLSKNVQDIEKFEYLLTVYAQIYSLLFYADVDVEEFDKTVGNLFELLYNLPIDKDYPLITNAHYLVFMLLHYLLPDDDLFEHAFKDLTSEQKDELVKIMDTLTKKLN